MMQSPILDASQYPGSVIIPNGTGQQEAAYLAKALLTIQTNFSGASDPATVSGLTVLPFMTWDDTGNNIRKIRNQANNGWISLIDLTTGNLLTNAATSTNCIGNAATATLASAAKGDARFQYSANVGGSPTINANSSYCMAGIRRKIPAGKKFYLKRICYQVNNNARITIQFDSQTYTTLAIQGEETPNFLLYDNSASGSDFLAGIVLWVSNTLSSSITASPSWSAWVDLSIE